MMHWRQKLDTDSTLTGATMSKPWVQLVIQVVTAVLAFLGTMHGVQQLPPKAAPPPQPDGSITFPIPRPAPPKPEPEPDMNAAIGRVTFGNVGCTASIVGPKRPDGRWDVLCASHCINGIGQRGSMRLPGGKVLGVQVSGFDRKADYSGLVSDTTGEEYPFGLLADSTPPVGTKVYHRGYGVDKPGNQEDGEITHMPNADGQTQFSLSVSSGDSGGPIIDSNTRRIVSCVCCTSSMAHKTSVWGASVESIRQGRKAMDVSDDWQALPIPIRGQPDKLSPFSP